jgi:hypothetical protein
LKRIENFGTILFLRRSRGSRDLGIHANKLAGTPLVFEFDYAGDHSEQRVILAAADILAGLPFRAALARQNIAAKDAFAPKLFQSQALGCRIAAITRRTYAFLMSHNNISDFRLPISD